MMQKGSNSNRYQFGFNGQLKDNEIYGDGNAYDYGARMYDSRTLRWFSVDPRKYEQPGWSPYKSFLGNPIIYIDPEGQIEKVMIFLIDENGTPLGGYYYYTDRVMQKTMETYKKINDIFIYKSDYYDFTTVKVFTLTKSNGIVESSSSSFIDKNSRFKYSKTSSNMFGSPNLPKFLEDKVEKVSARPGLFIWGSASSGSESRARKTTGKILGFFDFAEFADVLDIVTLSISKKDEIIETKMTPEKAAEMILRIGEARDKREEDRRKKALKDDSKIKTNKDSIWRPVEIPYGESGNGRLRTGEWEQIAKPKEESLE